MNQDLFNLNSKVAVVSGSFGLLGEQHCKALADAGAKVYAVDLEQSLDQRFAKYSKIVPFACDVTNRASLNKLRDRLAQDDGRLDVLVNNAAINDKVEDPHDAALKSRFEEYPYELFKKVLEVNVLGTFLSSQVLGPLMTERKSGSIINIGSTYGLVAPDQSLYTRPDGTQSFYKSPAYPTSKGAVVQFTKFLAAYWGSQGVRVNCLCPGGVEASQEEFFLKNYAARTPLGRMASPTDYKGALVFLASEASSYMTGATLVVDGGFTAW